MSAPPLVRAAIWIAARLAPAEWRDTIAGDLEEERRRRLARGVRAGALWALTSAAMVIARLRTDRLRAARWRPKPGGLMSVLGDLREAARRLAASPVYTFSAVVILALGLGVNAAAFGASWHFLLKPLPWPDGDRIVQIWNTNVRNSAVNVLAPANYLDFEREARGFERIAAYTYFSYALNLTGAGEPREAAVRAVTADYFAVFGTPAMLGRTLDGRDVTDGQLVAVIGEGLWRRQFGAAPDVIGRRIQFDDRAYEVVGVMPASFDVGVRPLDAWVPYVFTDQVRQRRLGYFLGAVGRLKPDVSVDQASAELGAIAARAASLYPSSNATIGALARPIREELTGTLRNALLIVTGSAALVLLLTCANLTSLQLGRLAALQRELAVRAALGATRARLFRLLLAEGVVLAIAGGLLGSIAGWWSIRGVAAFAPPSVANAVTLTLDAPLIAYMTLLSLTAGVLFAAIPAWRASRPVSTDALRGRSASDRGAGRIRAALVTIEVAIASALLVVASVLVVSLANVLQVDPGFDAAGVVAADVRLAQSRYPGVAQKVSFFEALFERLDGQPGVRDVCATNTLPLEAAATMTYVPDGTSQLIAAAPVTVTERCFAALGIGLRRGRLFDAREAKPVAIVSEAYARRAFAGGDALGKVIRVGMPDGQPLTVIGIVEDSRRVSLEAAAYGQVYRLANQEEFFVPARVVLRTDAPLDQIAPTLRAAVRERDAAQPIENIRSLETVVSRSLAPRRFNLTLLATFAVLALVLAAIGLYGLLAQSVSQRRAEIGVRIALGAQRGSIMRLVLVGAVGCVALGIGLGFAGALAAETLLRRLAFGVSPTAPAIYASAAAFLTVIAAVAAAVPTRRALPVDPAAALRAE